MCRIFSYCVEGNDSTHLLTIQYMIKATEEQLTLPNVAGDHGKKIKIKPRKMATADSINLPKAREMRRTSSLCIGSGTTDLSCFWSTLPVLDFVICAMVACRVFCNDNRIGSAYSWGLLAPHVEIYYLARIS